MQTLERCANSKLTKDGVNVTTLLDSPNTESIDMNIADSEFIFDILTDISKDKYQYVVRECFSNAYDATLKAHSIKPIEIKVKTNVKSDMTMASRLFETEQTGVAIFSVKDYGVGMSPDDVKKYFLQYGGSKKRAENDIDAIGSKGLGAKAPLAISNSFAIKTTKDGITTEAIIYKTNKGYNKADMSSITTHETSGTTVYIPIQKQDAYKLVNTTLQLCPIHVNAIFETDMVSNDFGQKTSLGINDLLSWKENDTKTFGARCHRLTTTIKNDFGNDTKGPQSLNTNKDLVYFGTTTIDNADISIWVRLKNLMNDNGIGAFVIPRNLTICYNIGGFEYGIKYNPDIYVDLPAGFLNFTPSRDDIKHDKQYAQLRDLIYTWIESGYADIMNTHYIDFIHCYQKCRNAIRFVVNDKEAFIKLNQSDTEIDVYGEQTSRLTKDDIALMPKCYTRCMINVATTCQKDTIIATDMDLYIEGTNLRKNWMQEGHKQIKICPWYDYVAICFIGSPDIKNAEIIRALKKLSNKYGNTTFIFTTSDKETERLSKIFTGSAVTVITDLTRNNFAIACGKFKKAKSRKRQPLQLSYRASVFTLTRDTWIKSKHTLSTATKNGESCIAFTDDPTSVTSDFASFAKIKCAACANRNVKHVYVVPAMPDTIKEWANENNIPCVIRPGDDCDYADLDKKFKTKITNRELNKALHITTARQLMSCKCVPSSNRNDLRYVQTCVDTIKDIVYLPKDIMLLVKDEIPTWVHDEYRWSIDDYYDPDSIKPNDQIEAFIHAINIVTFSNIDDVNLDAIICKARAIRALMRAYLRQK